MSQKQQILLALKKGKKLTPMDALHLFGCWRLSGRILELRRLGYDVKTRIIERNEKRFAEYYLK